VLELYHWEPNGLFLKPLIALHEKETAFTSHYFDAGKLEQLADDFPTNAEAFLNLEREGPLLVAFGTLISSTFFMLEYINDALPGIDLKPGTAYQRYRMQAWGQKTALMVAPAVCALGSATYLAKTLTASEAAAVRSSIEGIEPMERRELWLAVIDDRYGTTALQSMRDRLRAPVASMEQTLCTSRWLAGDQYSVADIDAYAMLKPLPSLAPDVVNEKATPAITDFLATMHDRPAVRKAMAMARTDHPERCFVPGCEASRWG